VAVCSENATRLGVANVEYVFARPGTPLPFGDDTFDGIMASSSVEQTPDPQATLAELFRVLRPAGRLRINYESLSGYRNGHERDAFLWGMGADRCRLILYDRDIEHECVRQYGLTYAVSQKNLVKLLDASERSLTFDSLTIQRLEALSYRLLDARVCRTTHPSGQTLATWPLDIGFSEVYPTHSGSTSAGMLFDSIPKKRHPSDLQGVDELVRPLAEVVCALASPLDTDPMLTAVK
jgi:SAM-dependent methyltransferase